MADHAFEDAYELLLIRARTENSLEEAVKFWTAVRQADNESVLESDKALELAA